MVTTSNPERGPSVRIIGGGLAGSEVAWQLARRGVSVELCEQKPAQRSAAHTSDQLAELVCSNSLRSDRLENAVGLLKAELRLIGSGLLRCADATRVPAGGALAVDRAAFSTAVEALLAGVPTLCFARGQVAQLADDDRPTVVASGPLTDGALAAEIRTLTGSEALFFYDAIAPIVDASTLDLEQLFAASRYGRGDADDYLNLPLDHDAYYRFVQALLDAPKVTPHDFEDRTCFEGCLPIEVMAARGPDVLAFGPLKPVGLIDPRTGRRPFAAVQLRKEDLAGSARNLVGFQTRLTHPAQLAVLRSLPGMQHAQFLRLGSVHRNTYVDAPRALDDGLRLRARPTVWLAGQITGSEGYVEAIAVGALVAISVLAALRGQPFVAPPPTTALGGLYRHLRGPHPGAFAPSNVNWAQLAAYPGGRNRAEQRRLTAERACAEVASWAAQWE